MKVKQKSNLSVTNKRNPEKTKASILNFAAELFAERGFHGTGLNEICEKARANKRMIYHYYGNKEALYLAVHRKEWETLGGWFLKEFSARNGSDISDESRLLIEAVRIFHDFVTTHPLFVRLLMWDGLEGGRASRSLWKDIRGPIYRQLEGLVLRAQDKGFIAQDLKASHLIISFMGAIAFYFSHAATMVDIFHKDALSPEAVEERKEQILALFGKLIQG
jgi:TetR/AcrR family transcriptional regulator